MRSNRNRQEYNSQPTTVEVAASPVDLVKLEATAQKTWLAISNSSAAAEVFPGYHTSFDKEKKQAHIATSQTAGPGQLRISIFEANGEWNIQQEDYSIATEKDGADYAAGRKTVLYPISSVTPCSTVEEICKSKNGSWDDAEIVRILGGGVGDVINEQKCQNLNDSLQGLLDQSYLNPQHTQAA